MNIIPGAGYVSPSEKRMYIGDADGELLYLADNISTVWTSADVGPKDLTLVYVPGDQVVEGIPRSWRTVVYKGDIE